jgi:hypothetical protein
MRTFGFLISLAITTCVLASCYRNSAPEKTSENKIKKRVLEIAETYASKQLKNPEKTVSPTGVITINDEERKYIIDPSKVFIGLIDDDSNPDALVSIASFRDQKLDQIEHLVILKTNGKYMLIKSIESDMNILEVKDRIITAQIHTRPRNSPLYWCSSCLEIVKYRYQNGQLEKI